MIKSFLDREAEKIYHQEYSKKIPVAIQKIALRKLMMLDNAQCLNDLRVSPGNRLESLGGERKGQYSIRINNQYRICFRMIKDRVYQVEIVDYH